MNRPNLGINYLLISSGGTEVRKEAPSDDGTITTLCNMRPRKS